MGQEFHHEDEGLEKPEPESAPPDEGLENVDIPRPFRERLPDTRASVTHKFSVCGTEGYLIVGLFEDGRPGELFIKVAKEGSTLGGLLDTIGQHGFHDGEFCRQRPGARDREMDFRRHNAQLPSVRYLLAARSDGYCQCVRIGDGHWYECGTGAGMESGYTDVQRVAAEAGAGNQFHDQGGVSSSRVPFRG